jgi:hypothetical protein
MVVSLAGILAMLIAVSATMPTATARPADDAKRTFADAARSSLATLLHRFYAGKGLWHTCLPDRCATENRDWGADSLTYAIWLRWAADRDRTVRPILRALVRTAPDDGAQTHGLSDVPLWDSIAAAREYQVTHLARALRLSKSDFAFVASKFQARFGTGACPSIDYQHEGPGGDNLKTLETDANYIKAAVLLRTITGRAWYLRDAVAKYDAVRQYFFEPSTNLYTVFVFDNGQTCRAVPARYFGSVNGLMIWNGVQLARLTDDPRFDTEAVRTARAVATSLSDPAGIYADPQAEDDTSEPLVEAMYIVATSDRRAFARSWLLSNAAASASARNSQGVYDRFFDGPPPTSTATAWQSGGGLALQFAAAALDPHRAATDGAWNSATFVPHRMTVTSRAHGFTFNGRAVAIIGALGARCCQAGHARVYVDGKQLVDQTGIWQDKPHRRRPIPGTVLFAWRWPRSGRHRIEIRPGIANAKEGPSFFSMTGYDVIR